jgi:hypothetical protein
LCDERGALYHGKGLIADEPSHGAGGGAEPVGAVSKGGDGASGVPVNSAEISATQARAGVRSICAGPGRFAQAQHQRLTGGKEAK